VWASREAMVVGLTMEPRLMAGMEMVARNHIRRQVHDPELRRRLTPTFRLGCKRILVSDDYYPTLTRPGVQVVTDGIAEVRERSIVSRDGTEREVDTIIFGTGFQVTEPPSASYVRGRDGTLLADAWQRQGMSAYLGTSIAGFPNAFMLTGPNTGLGHSSMVYMIESQIAHVMEAIKAMDRHGGASIEVRQDVQEAYNDELHERLGGTVWNQGGCKSWYLDKNGRNTTLWPSFTFRFRRRARNFDAADYEISGRGGRPHGPSAGAPHRSTRGYAAAGSAR
jgi:cation diffusion facilitator CzcD-associated flavoprotein CzcO